MNRRELAEHVEKKSASIPPLYDYKNSDYGADGDAFANFRKTAERILIPFIQRHGGGAVDIYDAMACVAMIYQDKHLVALSHTGLDGNEVDERLGDVANYSFIIGGINEAKKQSQSRTCASCRFGKDDVCSHPDYCSGPDSHEESKWMKIEEAMA